MTTLKYKESQIQIQIEWWIKSAVWKESVSPVCENPPTINIQPACENPPTYYIQPSSPAIVGTKPASNALGKTIHLDPGTQMMAGYTSAQKSSE